MRVIHFNFDIESHTFFLNRRISIIRMQYQNCNLGVEKRKQDKILQNIGGEIKKGKKRHQSNSNQNESGIALLILEGVDKAKCFTKKKKEGYESVRNLLKYGTPKYIKHNLAENPRRK